MSVDPLTRAFRLLRASQADDPVGVCPFCEPVIEADNRVLRAYPCDEHERACYEGLARQRLTPRANIPNVDRPWSPYPEPR